MATSLSDTRLRVCIKALHGKQESNVASCARHGRRAKQLQSLMKPHSRVCQLTAIRFIFGCRPRSKAARTNSTALRRPDSTRKATSTRIAKTRLRAIGFDLSGDVPTKSMVQHLLSTSCMHIWLAAVKPERQSRYQTAYNNRCRETSCGSWPGCSFAIALPVSNGRQACPGFSESASQPSEEIDRGSAFQLRQLLQGNGPVYQQDLAGLPP